MRLVFSGMGALERGIFQAPSHGEGVLAPGAGNAAPVVQV